MEAEKPVWRTATVQPYLHRLWTTGCIFQVIGLSLVTIGFSLEQGYTFA